MNIDAFWKAVIQQNADELRTFFHKNAYVNWHCSNEHFTVEEYIQANCEYPGVKCTQSQGHNEIPKTRELLCDHRSGQKLFIMHRRFALQRINA